MSTRSPCFHRWLVSCLSGMLAFVLASTGLAQESKMPITVGLTAEFGVQGSHAAQSIEKGILVAIDEINAAGGLLGGRPLVLDKRDDRGLPARGIDNYLDFATSTAAVAVFCGRYSPVAVEIAQIAGKQGLTLLDPWAAADPITLPHPGGGPNHVFRLSLTDTWAMNAMLEHARQRGFKRLALLVPNTAWGRSNEAALLARLKREPGISHEPFWYNWGDTDFRNTLQQLLERGAQAIVMVANEQEGLAIVTQLAQFPEARRLPVISHWGILGGDFHARASEALDKVDLSVVHTFSFSDERSPRAQAVAEAIRQKFGIEANALRAQVGFAHAYDLTHLLARAIRKAGSSDRAKVRAALEQLGPYDGLVRAYTRPFTPERHEALEPGQVRMGRFTRDGSLQSLGSR